MKRLLILILLLIPIFCFSQTEREMEMFHGINELRTNPSSYIKYLVELKKEYENDRKNSIELINTIKDSKSLFYKSIDTDKLIILTGIQERKYENATEFIYSIDEAIKFLDTITPVGELKFNINLYQALEKYDFNKCESVNKDGTFTIRHTKLDNSHCGENICVGEREVITAILQLIIDKGVETRGHRKNLFNKDWTQIAVYEVKYLKKITFVQKFESDKF